MKKIFAVLLVLSLGATTFSSSGKFGMDFSQGMNLGFQNLSGVLGGKKDGVEGKLKRTDLAIPVVRISSYNFFLLNDMLGAFASANLSFGMQFGDKFVSDAGGTFDGDTFDAFLGIEFMVGPALGIDLNERLRLQTGLGFHYLFENGLVEAVSNEIATAGEVVPSFSLHAFGIGLTPQLRFTPSKKASFILGCDFTFDFGRVANAVLFLGNISEGAKNSEVIPGENFDGYFRFGFSPFAGVGINF